MSPGEDDNIIRFPPPRPAAKPPPMINLPPATKWFAVLLLLIHAGLVFGLSPDRQYWIDSHLGFLPGAYTGVVPFTWPAAFAPLTYMLLHGSWEHVVINVVTLAAFGAGVERWLGGRRMLALFVLCSLAAIAVQFAMTPHSTDPVIGASGGLSGLFAAILVLMKKNNNLPGRYGLWPVAIIWIVVSALFGLIGGPGGEIVAWVAHIGGFLAGLALMRFFRPPAAFLPVVRR